MHAHVSTESRDCDGKYERQYTRKPRAGQTDDDFRADTLWALLPIDLGPESDPVRVMFTRFGFDFTEPTEEGYRAVDVTWCTDDDADQPARYRDHTAESMGY